MDQIFSAALSQLAAQVIGSVTTEIQKNPQGLIEGLTAILNCGHSTEDVIQDLWDAVRGGHLSPTAALQATAILTADMERQRQKPATQQSDVDLARQIVAIRQKLEYELLRNH